MAFEPSDNLIKAPDTHLPKLEVGQAVLAGDLGKDASKVDAGRGPGGVEGDHPHHVLVPGDLLCEVVVTEVDNVLGALVGRFWEKESLQANDRYGEKLGIISINKRRGHLAYVIHVLLIIDVMLRKSFSYI